MIDPAQKKLNLIFLSILFTLSLCILAIIFLFIHYRLFDMAKEHINENIMTEFMPHYKANELKTMDKMIEDEHFQVFDKAGNITLDVKSSIHFNPPVNTDLFKRAFSDQQLFEVIKHNNRSYVISYSYLDQNHILRVTASLTGLSEFNSVFVVIILISLPCLLILSFIISRYMVKQAFKPIERVMMYQETFSSNITHELNSPLTAIKGNLEVSLKRERTAEEYRNSLKSVLKSVDGLINLLNNLYILALSDFKRLDLLKEKVSVSKILSDLEDKYEPLVFQKNINLKTSIKADIDWYCDASLMGRAIENLLDNAIKYTPNKGVIEIEARHEKAHLLLIVSNNCNNIEKDDVDNFFKPFYRGQEQPEGKGLGLFIVQYIVESHGGTIKADLNSGKLTFTVLIPHAYKTV